MKKIVALLLVAVLVLGLCATAFATVPTASMQSSSKDQWVRRGGKVYFTYKLKSGSYYGIRSSGKIYYRARFNSFTLYKKKTGREYAHTKNLYWTENGKQTYKWKVPSYYPTGKYVILYGTFYRTSIYSSTWYVGMAKTAKVYVY